MGRYSRAERTIPQQEFGSVRIFCELLLDDYRYTLTEKGKRSFFSSIHLLFLGGARLSFVPTIEEISTALEVIAVSADVTSILLIKMYIHLFPMIITLARASVL